MQDVNNEVSKKYFLQWKDNKNLISISETTKKDIQDIEKYEFQKLYIGNIYSEKENYFIVKT